AGIQHRPRHAPRAGGPSGAAAAGRIGRADHGRELWRGTPRGSGAQRGRLEQEPARRHRVPDSGHAAAAGTAGAAAAPVRSSRAFQLLKESAMRPIVLAALVSVLAAGCASVPPDQDPVQIRLNDLDGRISKVERVVSNQSLLQMAQQVDTLQAEVRDLRGQLDQLQNANRELQKQQHDFYGDLDKRVGALEHGGGGSGGTASGVDGQGSSSTEQSVYGQAFDALKAGSYSVAITGFQDFL